MQTKLWKQVVSRSAVALILGGLVVLLWKGLQNDPDLREAILQNQLFPEFTLSDIRDESKSVTLDDVKGKPFVVHIWATWCSSCIQEHPFWVGVSGKYKFPLLGILYRDNPAKVHSLLTQKSDPYAYLLSDPSGAIGLDLGIVGIPATFVVDAEGQICYSHFGEIDAQEFEQNILPLLALEESA